MTVRERNRLLDVVELVSRVGRRGSRCGERRRVVVGGGGGGGEERLRGGMGEGGAGAGGGAGVDRELARERFGLGLVVERALRAETARRRA